MAKNLSGLRAILIDDSPLIQQVVTAFLLPCGIKLEYASTKGEAITIFRNMNRLRYDFVLLDWYLGSESGIDVLRFIRESYSTLPVIMLTQEDEAERVVHAVTEGVSDYIIKPFTHETLITKIEGHIKR